MELDKVKVTNVISLMGYLPGTGKNEHIWKQVVDGITYGVDFKTGEIFRYRYDQREYEDPADETLSELRSAVEMAMNGSLERRGSDENEKATNQYHETPANISQTSEEDKPIETPAEGRPATSKLLDLIRTYVNEDVLEVFGDTGSGKSKFALAVAREAIAVGMKVFYLDTERNLTESDIAGLKGCEYRYTPIIEEIDKLVQKLPAVDVVIIDSIGFPVLTAYARMTVKQRGDALLKLIAIFGDLKKWAYQTHGFAVVTNQPESEFNKEPGHILRPFGDKSQFAAKEIWKTEIRDRKPALTSIEISAFRSRSVGHKTRIMDMKITGNGVEVV